ncbi:MAG: hypothetical protein ACW964_03820 [Candidatus Hodarchaeales archaeon]
MNLKVMLLFLLLLMMSIFTDISYSSNIDVHQGSFDIIQTPEGDEIEVGTSINLTIKYSGAITVDSVSLLYCSLEPEFYCHFPAIPLNETMQNSFMGVFIPEYEVGTVMGYHFSVTYDNGNTTELPDSSSFTNNRTNIRQAEDNQYYFELRIIKEYNTNHHETSWLNSYCVISFVFLIFWKRRTKNK